MPDNADVMVVENDPDIMELILFFLEREGFKVLPAGNGKVAIELIEKTDKPLVVLSEIGLPFMAGWQLLDYIKNKGLTHAKVIFLTNRTQEKEAVRMLELGAEDFVRKPFNPRELIARIRKVMRGSF